MTSALTRRGSTWRWRNVIRPAILARDNGVCWICGQDGADSVDHVIPRNQGGDDNPDNLRAAHLGCNVKRERGATIAAVRPAPSRRW